ncbi:MAG: DNA polymerase III subunit epsilon [Bdellovibrionales bacterium CG10_big_fil_rev_8_21_14_0_10_45_34]|nr:MAG: DNA polymerase III subunit epsilon [Bdellovibrionales bacterium CG10_big_fil_rev_8_21_14_0_10_45_34]
MDYIAFDLETTGFLAGVDQITEVGLVRFQGGKPIEKYCTLVNPRRSIPEGAIRVSGITDEMVKDAPVIEDLLEPLTNFVENAVMVAHNAPFDFQFLLADFKKYEVTAPDSLVLDTCAMSRKVFPGLLNYKLGTVVQHLKIPTSVFHRAEADAINCGHLFQEILKKTGSADGLPVIENLVALSNNQLLRFPKIERQPKQLAFI